MLHGRYRSFDDVTGVTLAELFAARFAAERAVRAYSDFHGLAQIQTNSDLPAHEFKKFNRLAAEQLEAAADDHWEGLATSAVLDAIALGNAGHHTEFEFGFTFPTVHAAADRMHSYLVGWLCETSGRPIRRDEWESIWGKPEISRDAQFELIARINFEWRNATVATELRNRTINASPPAPGAPQSEVEWSVVKSPKQWARIFGVSWRTLRRRMVDEVITARMAGSIQKWQFDVRHLPSFEQNEVDKKLTKS